MKTKRILFSSEIRQGIIDYYENTELEDRNMQGLLSSVGKKVGESVSLEDIKDSFYGHYDNLLIAPEKQDSLALFFAKAKKEQEAFGRLEKIIGLREILEKPVCDMENTDLRGAAIKMFRMPEQEYKQLANSKGVELDEDFFQGIIPEHCFDATLLLGVLRKSGQGITKDILVDIIKHTEIGLSYFEVNFKKRFEYYARNVNLFSQKDDIIDLWLSYRTNYKEQKDNLTRHIKVDKMLKAKHKISPPKLKDRSIQMDLMPLAIEFGNNDEIFVLGQRYYQTLEKEMPHRDLSLVSYNIQTGQKTNAIDTGIGVVFDGCALTTFSFQGNLSVGSNGLIYAGGNNEIKRFNQNLEEIDGNEGGFLDSLNILKKQEIIGSSKICHWSDMGIFQVTENQGIYYFIVRPERFPRCYSNMLVACEGSKLIADPILFSPSGGYGRTNFDDNARMVVDENNIYLKVNHDILSIDKSLTKKAIENSYKVIDGEKLIHGCIPCNHCLDNENLLWAETQIKEEATPSIKAYNLEELRGEIMTHFYPLNDYETSPALRSMSINNEKNLLAVSQISDNRILFYDLN
jgi:hypothetical protein